MAQPGPDALADLRERFADYDADGDGRIMFAEFCELMAELDDELSRKSASSPSRGPIATMTA